MVLELELGLAMCKSSALSVVCILAPNLFFLGPRDKKHTTIPCPAPCIQASPQCLSLPAKCS